MSSQSTGENVSFQVSRNCLHSFYNIIIYHMTKKKKKKKKKKNVDMIRLMGKPTIYIGENKDADQLRGNRSAPLFSHRTNQRLCFRIVQILFYLNLKFQASSSFLCLYRSVCVGPVRKPHCWFSHEAAHFSIQFNMT